MEREANMKAKLTVTYTYDDIPGYFKDYPTSDEIAERRTVVAVIKDAGKFMAAPLPSVGGRIIDTHVTVDLYDE